MDVSLQPQVARTKDGLYLVNYARLKAPLDVQEAAFTANGLQMVSPAELGYLRTSVEDGPFLDDSRTNMDVLYDDRDGGRVVLLENKAISRLFLSDFVNAHRRGKEFIIPKDQRDLVYAIADTMLKNGKAVATSHGEHRIDTSRFGEEELTQIIYNDSSFGIKATDYGEMLKEVKGRDTQSIFFDDKDYANSREGPYLNRLRVYGPDDGFDVLGYCGGLDYGGGAFGVFFKKTAEGGEKNPSK